MMFIERDAASSLFVFIQARFTCPAPQRFVRRRRGPCPTARTNRPSNPPPLPTHSDEQHRAIPGVASGEIRREIGPRLHASTPRYPGHCSRTFLTAPYSHRTRSQFSFRSLALKLLLMLHEDMSLALKHPQPLAFFTATWYAS
jgi:hypothetical protein